MAWWAFRGHPTYPVYFWSIRRTPEGVMKAFTAPRDMIVELDISDAQGALIDEINGARETAKEAAEKAHKARVEESARVMQRECDAADAVWLARREEVGPLTVKEQAV